MVLKTLKKNALHELHLKLMKARGFRIVMKVDGFFRAAGEVEQFFGVRFLTSARGCKVEPTVGVRVRRIEEILTSLDPNKYRDPKYSTTVGADAGGLGGESGMFDTVVASIGDIDELVRKSEMVLRDVAEPYYDANSNLDVLERKLNSEEVVLRDALDPISRSYRGLIAARLVGRDLDELEERYRHLVHRYAKGTVDADFSRFVDGLRSMDNLGFVGAR